MRVPPQASQTEKTTTATTDFLPAALLNTRFTSALITLIAALTLMGATASAQVTVAGSTGADGPYTTLKGAFDAINTNAVQTGNNISINISANTTETATAALNTGDWATVTIRPTVAGVSVSGSIVGAIIKLNGADNVTIDGRIGGAGTNRDLAVRNNNTSTATAAIWLASVVAGNGASNNTVRNLEIACGADQQSLTVSTFGIIQTGTTISTTSTDGNDNDNNSFIANRIIKVRYGIVSRGVTTNNNINPVITDNIIGPTAFGSDQIGKAGIYMQADTGATISRNLIQNVGVLAANTAAGADRIGIGIGGESWSVTDSTTITSGDYTVTRNTIQNIIEEKTFSAIGIKLGTTRSGVATNNLVANNFIINVRANGTSGDQFVGIGISGGNGDRVVFNAISITGDVDPAGAAASSTWGGAIRIPGANAANNANFTIQNNSIYLDVNSNTAAQHYFAITLNSAAYTFGTGGLNRNNYYINAANPQLRTGGLGTTTTTGPGTEFTTLANWQVALTAPQDAQSIQADPLYFSNTSDLHVSGSSPNVDSNGIAIAGVADDIDGQVRPNPSTSVPDIGADEFYTSPGTLQFSSATYSATEGSGIATITVTRTGGQNGAVQVDYATVAGGSATGGAACTAGVDYINTNGTLMWADLDTAPKNFTVTICNDGVFEASETVNLALSNVMGATLGTPNTAVLTILNSSTFGSSVNVGTSETITSLTNPDGLFDQINTGVLTSNLTANITSDLTAETGTVPLNQFAGGFTVTIQPSGGVARLVSGSNAIALIDLNGADGVTFNGLNTGGNSLLIRNTNVATGSTIRFINDASNDSLLNCTFEQGNGSTTILATTGVSTGNDNLVISGNVIRDRSDVVGVPFNGFASIGTSAAISNGNISITNNQIFNFNQAAILVNGPGNDNFTITGNDIFSTAPRTTVQIGLFFSGSGTTTISLNKIHDLRTSVVGGGTGSTFGMLLTDARNTTVSRNRIYNFPAVAAGTGRIVGIEFDGASGTAAAANLVNNMISIVTSVATNQSVMGIFDFSFGGNTFTADYNSIYIGGTNSGTQASWALVRGILAPDTYTARNNICFNNRTGGGANHFAGGDQSANTGTFVSNFNFFAGTGTTPANFMDYGTSGVGTPVSFAAWQAGPPARDANSVAGIASSFTPSTFFVNQDAGDLHLKSTATPVLDAGTPVAGITTDFDDQPRSATTPDIGADELVLVNAGDLIISEFRLRGPAGPNDEFIEVYNATGAALNVQSADGSAGVAVAASDGTTRCVILNGTIIPAGGHFLCVNSSASGYSLTSYASADGIYSTDIPDNAGIAIFNNATGGASFSLANRLDAAGSASEANATYKEGTGYPALNPLLSPEYSFFRNLATGLPKDTGDNAADFVFADTQATTAGPPVRLGAPGPENLNGPIQRNATIKAFPIDNGCPTSSGAPPAQLTTCARHRDPTAGPNAAQGTLSIRRNFKNNTGSPLTRLRFRAVDMTTFPAAAGAADLRLLTSSTYSATCVSTGGGCTAPGNVITIEGTTKEEPPTQPNGGGLNSSVSAGTITLLAPLAPGASINLQFLLGVQTGGAYRFFVNVEALP